MISAPRSGLALGRQPRTGGIEIARLRRQLGLFWPILAVSVASIASQWLQGTTTDVSCLIVLSERLLDGQTAYIDFFEVNPPASILLYVPAVFVVRLLGVSAEVAVKASIYLLLFGSVLLCRRIEGRRRPDFRESGHLQLAAYAAIFLILPGGDFAQRDTLSP